MDKKEFPLPVSINMPHYAVDEHHLQFLTFYFLFLWLRKISEESHFIVNKSINMQETNESFLIPLFFSVFNSSEGKLKLFISLNTWIYLMRVNTCNMLPSCAYKAFLFTTLSLPLELFVLVGCFQTWPVRFVSTTWQTEYSKPQTFNQKIAFRLISHSQTVFLRN